MKTQNRKFPIPDTKNYTIDLVTHEIFNREGKRMKPFVDSRGRVSTKLMRTDGKQRVYVVKDIAIRVSDTIKKKKEVLQKDNKLLTYELFFANIDVIKAEDTSIAMYSKAKELIGTPDLDVLKQLIRFIA